jgi:hypothetical protein
MKGAGVSRRSAAVHGWRKELKVLWYQLRLVDPLTTGIAPLVRQLKRLETELGEDHNLVVLGATLRGCRDLRSMRAEVASGGAACPAHAPAAANTRVSLGRRLHRRKPGAFGRWLRRSRHTSAGSGGGVVTRAISTSSTPLLAAMSSTSSSSRRVVRR